MKKWRGKRFTAGFRGLCYSTRSVLQEVCNRTQALVRPENVG